MKLNIPDSADVIAHNQSNLGSASDLKRQVETLNIKLASALKNYPLSVLAFLASVDIAVVLLWACVPLLTKPAPDDNYLNYWFFLGYYSFTYMLGTANLCFAGVYIYTGRYCCNTWKDYFVCISLYTLSNFVVGGIPGVATESLKALDTNEKNYALKWLEEQASSKIYWPLLPVTGSAVYLIWCAGQCRNTIQKSKSLNSEIPALEVTRNLECESKSAASASIGMRTNVSTLTFKGFASWIAVISLLVSTYYQGQIFSYFYFETAPHTLIIDVISISAFNFWIVIGMKNICAFVAKKYAKRSDLIYVIYTFTQFTSHIFYRNLILAKSLRESSVVVVVNISGLLTLLKIVIACSKRYFFYIHPELAEKQFIDSSTFNTSTSVLSNADNYKKTVDNSYKTHIRSVALDYGETVRVQIITMISFFCWTFMIRSGPNSNFYPVFSELKISDESLHFAILLSIGILFFECFTNIIIWTVVKKLYRLDLWREYTANLVENPFIVWVNSFAGIHILGDMLVALVALEFHRK